MKATYQLLPAVVLCAVLSFSSCKKDNPNTTSTQPNYQQQNQDVNDYKAEDDNVNSDVNTAVGNTPGFSKNQATTGVICGGSIDASHINDATPSITLTYDGSACFNRKRTGSIKIELINGTKWSDAGAVLRITHTNYKVTFTNLNNHYITFNGVKYLTDVNGINWLALFAGTDTLTLKERNYGLNVTFDNGQQASWQTARITKYWLANSVIYATVNGDTTINNKVTDSWGTTRFNTQFTTTVAQPWQSNTSCGWWQPTRGIYTCTTDNFTITATLGTDAGGTQVNSGCAYGLKLDWTITSPASTGNAVLQYW